MMKRAALLLALAGCAVDAPGPELPPLPAPPPLTAKDYYQWAESLYQLGDCQRSLHLCESALRLDPRHPAAQALYLELNFIAGNGSLAASAQGRLSYVESLLEEGRRQLFFGELAAAEDCADRALRVAQTLPPEMDVELRLHQVRSLLEWIRACEED